MYSIFSENEIADFLYASVLAKLTLYYSLLQSVFFLSLKQIFKYIKEWENVEVFIVWEPSGCIP